MIPMNLDYLLTRKCAFDAVLEFLHDMNGNPPHGIASRIGEGVGEPMISSLLIPCM